ncbi:MAG: glycosyltransferase family 4 protein [Mucilaginibacter sp.]|nr:glycosyltransferase family 4 protein [Mucilaginibacter sp.]
MKIAITADPFIPVPPVLYGGIERIIELLINELTQQGHEVTLFAHRDSTVSCRLVPYPGENKDFKNALVINKRLIAEKFDLIHSFGRLVYLLPQLFRRTPVLMSYQREPTIRQIKRAMMISLKGTLSFTGCSNYITDQIRPFAPVYTVYNGVDIRKYTPQYRVAQNAPLVFLGRIEPIKGPHTAIEIALTTGRPLLIAGNIPADHTDYFDRQIKPLLNDQITYLGPVNDEQKNELLGKALALLMPIHWEEPFGIVMIEAMACGTPVLALRRGAVPEVVTEGLNGFSAETPEGLMGKVDLLAGMDRKKVRMSVEKLFSPGVITAEYVKIYNQLIGA